MNNNGNHSVGQSNLGRGVGAVLRMVRRYHFSPFKFYINREKRIAVVLNPKVGTKSIRHTLSRCMIECHGWKDASNGRLRIIKKAREFPFAPLCDYWHALAHTEDYDFYCFVRNPYARLKSAWLNKLAFGHIKGYSKSVRKQMLGPVRRFAKKQSLPGGQPNTEIPFDTFVSFVESEPSGRRDHHFDDQHSVLFMDSICYARVFKMETQFHQGMRHILSSMGLSGTSIVNLLGTHRNKSNQPKDPIFSEGFARKVKALYARDFEMLRYDPDSWKGL